jgi:anthranilate phosphoribosyltransferase
VSDPILRALSRVARRQDLDRELSAEVFRAIMRGSVDPAQIGGLLVGLAAKGETVDELEGAARALREAVVPTPTRRHPLVDSCGTGGSGVARRNVSTAVAIAVAACGVAVAKHGNRAASSRSGSADVLEALGLDLSASPARVGRCIDEVGVGFLFARALHPAMRHAAPVRTALGIRTIFNLLGPLTNPAGIRRQMLGLYDPRRCGEIAAVLGRLGSERVFVVHGFSRGVSAGPDAPPGIDDLSPEGESWVVELQRGARVEHVLSPADADLEPVPLAELAGGDPADNARAMRALFAGEKGAYRTAVQLSGALTLLVAGDEPLAALPAHARRIGEVLDDGSAAAVLARLLELGGPGGEP